VDITKNGSFGHLSFRVIGIRAIGEGHCPLNYQRPLKPVPDEERKRSCLCLEAIRRSACPLSSGSRDRKWSDGGGGAFEAHEIMDDHFDGARNLPDDFPEKHDTPRIGSKGLEGRKPQRLLIEGYRVGTSHFSAKRANKGVSERAAPFFNSYHGREDLLLAFHNQDIHL
jgi:hypothetical protein